MPTTSYPASSDSARRSSSTWRTTSSSLRVGSMGCVSVWAAISWPAYIARTSSGRGFTCATVTPSRTSEPGLPSRPEFRLNVALSPYLLNSAISR